MGSPYFVFNQLLIPCCADSDRTVPTTAAASKLVASLNATLYIMSYSSFAFFVSRRTVLACFDDLLKRCFLLLLPKNQASNDAQIMDLILKSKKFQSAQIRMLNYCRLYLGAVTFSDLTSSAHLALTWLDNAKLNGQISRLRSQTRWLTIHQDRPSAYVQLTLWGRVNKLWSTPKGRLNCPLGRWLRPNDKRRVSYPAYVSGNTLALRVHEEYQVVYNMDATRRQVGPPLPLSLRYEDLHPDAHVNLADVYEAPDGVWWTVRTVSEVVAPVGAPVYDSFLTYTQTLPTWEADLLQHIQLVLDPAYLCFDLQHYFYAGSDGSVKFETNGSFG